LPLWKERATNVCGKAVDATHYMAEEIPQEIADNFISFFNEQKEITK